MIRFLAILVCCVSALIRVSGQNAPSPDVIGNLSRAASRVETMTCCFVQTKHLSLLADEMVSRGTMSFKRPGLMRWEYTSPYSYRFVFDGDRVFVGNDHRSNVMDAKSNRMFGQIARIMISTVTGQLADAKSDFDISVGGTDESPTLTLTPRKREIKQLLSSVDLVLDTSANIVKEIKLREKNGDVTDIVLSDIVLNKPLDASLFVIP